MTAYTQVCSDYLQLKYNPPNAQAFKVDSVSAGQLAMLPYLFAVVALPFLGISLDKYGKRSLSISLSFVTLLTGFIMTISSAKKWVEIASLILVGLSYTLFGGSIYSSVQMLVETESVGTAIGLLMCIGNIGKSIAPLIVGLIKDHTTSGNGYFWVIIFFISSSCFGFLVSLVLMVGDMRSQQILWTVGRKF